MNDTLIRSISDYLWFVNRDSVAPERTEAHDEMMWQMRLAGIQFVDRDDAREIALEIERDNYYYSPIDDIEWVICAWHDSLKG